MLLDFRVMLLLLLMRSGTLGQGANVEPVGSVECAKWQPSDAAANRCGGVVPSGASYARLKETVGGAGDEAYSNVKDEFITTAVGAGIDVEVWNECTSRVLGLVCYVVLPRCIPIADTGEWWRERVCLSECELLEEECPDEYAVLVALEPTANALGLSLRCPTLTYDDGYLFKSHRNYSASSPPWLAVNVSGATYQMECSAPYFNNVTQCAGDRVKDTDGVCQPQCPVGRKVYSESEWDTLDQTLQVGGWVSLVLGVVMVATWSLQTRKRTFPSRFILFFSLCLVLMSVAMVLGGFGDIRCHNEYTPQRGSTSGRCMAQGVLWMLGSMGMTLWWLAFVVTLFLIISKDVDTADLKKKEWMFHVVVWPLCVLPTVIAVGGGLIRYNPTGMLCFVSNEHGAEWQLALYYVPQLTLLLVGTLLSAWVFRMVVSNARRINAYKAVSAVSRFIVFIPMYVVILAVFLAAAMRKLDVNTVLRDGYSVYYTCLTNTAADDDTIDFDYDKQRTQCAQDAYSAIQQFPLDMASRLMFGAMGFWIFCVFGLQKQNWHFWKRQVRRLRNGVSSVSGSTTGSRRTRASRSTPGSHGAQVVMSTPAHA